MASHVFPVLLLPEHIEPTPSHLPLLRSLQRLLNDSYTKTYCNHPELFGTTHLRLADPAQLADIVGRNGFTIVLVKVSEDDASATKVGEIVATGSVKDFGDGEVEKYADWSQNLGGKEWKAKRENQKESKSDKKESNDMAKNEVTAFAVSTTTQGQGLGARVLEEIEWVVSKLINPSENLQRFENLTANVQNIHVREDENKYSFEALDLNDIRQKHKIDDAQLEFRKQKHASQTLVLMGIRELGNESYYQRRGFKSVWSGPIPVGMWDCRKECTMVYMEKQL